MKETLDDIVADIDNITLEDLRQDLSNAESSDNLDDLLANLSDAKYELEVMLREVNQLIERTKA